MVEKKTGKKKTEKYLTQMKELPPEKEAEMVKETTPKKAVPEESEVKKPIELQPKREVLEEKIEPKLKLPLTIKDIILNIVNLISIISLVVILLSFSDKAKELKQLRLEKLKNEANVTFEFSKIQEDKTKSNALSKLFLNDAGVVNFVDALEKIKNESGTIKSVTFANQGPVKDRSGNIGVPVVIEFQGTWEAIDIDLQKFDKLPFLFRAAEIEIGKPKPQLGEEENTVVDTNIVVFKYGLILYYEE